MLNLEPVLSATKSLTLQMITERRLANLEQVAEHVYENYSPRGMVGFFFRQPKSTFDTKDPKDRFLNFGAISFVAAAQIEYFESAGEVSERLNLLSALPTLRVDHFGPHVLITAKSLSDREVAKLRDLMLVFYNANDADQNNVENAARHIFRDPKRSRGGEWRPNGLADIGAAIADEFKVDVGYYIVDQPEPPVHSPKQAPTPRLEDFSLKPRAAKVAVASLLVSERLQRATRRSLKEGQGHSGSMRTDDGVRYYKVLPVILSELRDGAPGLGPASRIVGKTRAKMNRLRIAAIIILGEAPIERLCVAYAQEVIEHYVGTANHAEKIATLNAFAQARGDQQLQLMTSPFDGSDDQRARLRTLADSVCAALIQVTAAHSATVRFYEPFYDELEPIGSAFCETLPSLAAEAFPISADEGYSLNGFVFRRLKAGEYVYLTNVRDGPPDFWRKRGLRHVLQCRTQSSSEVCLPIFKTGLCIGSLNVEAAEEHGFDRDLSFITAIGQQLGDFVDMVIRSSDAGWMPRLSLLHFTAHEQLKLRVARQAVRDRDPLSADPREHRMGTAYIDPKNLDEVPTERFLQNAMCFAIRKLGCTEESWPRVLEVSGSLPDTLSARHAASLDVILENLLENAKYHDRLEHPIRLRFTTGVDRVPKLVITYESKDTRLFANATDRIGIAPLFEPLDDTYHLGTFLAGVHTRMLGGMMWVQQPRASAGQAVPFRYQIDIPLGRDPRLAPDEVAP